MKRFLTLFVTLVALVSLASCNKKGAVNVAGITLAGQDTEVALGEEFTTEGLVVTVKYTDDSTADVTDKAVVLENVDENTAGKYLVVVLYEGAYATYEVAVVAPVEIEYATVAEAVESGLANADKVAEGVATLINNNIQEDYEYFFADNYFKTVSYTAYSDIAEHYELLEDGTVFGVKEEMTEWGGVYPADGEPTDIYLKGTYFGSIINYNENYDAFGVDGLVEALYLMATETGKNLVETANGVVYKYQFSFECPFGDDVNGTYYYINVRFNLDTATGSIANAAVDMYGYSYTTAENEAAEQAAAEEAGRPYTPVDMIYDPVADTYTLKEYYNTYSYIKIFEAEQVAAEKTYVPEYSAKNVLYQSFDLVDANGAKVEEGTTVNAYVQNNFVLTVDAVTPDTVNPALDSIKVNVTDANGDEVWSVYGSCLDGQNVEFTIGNKTGAYNVTVSTKLVEVNFVINVDYADVTEINAAEYNDYYELEAITEKEIYVGTSYAIQTVANIGAKATATAALKEATDKATVEVIDGEIVFSATETGTYVVVLTSTENTDVTCELTITVNPAPEIKDILNGKYKDAYESYTIVFTPESEGATNGTIDIKEASWYGPDNEYTGTYAWNAETKEIDLVVDGFAYALVVTENYGVGLDMGWGEPEELIKAAPTTSNVYVGTFIHPKLGAQEWTLTLNSDGTASYNILNGLEGTFSWYDYGPWGIGVSLESDDLYSIGFEEIEGGYKLTFIMWDAEEEADMTKYVIDAFLQA